MTGNLCRQAPLQKNCMIHFYNGSNPLSNKTHEQFLHVHMIIFSKMNA